MEERASEVLKEMKERIRRVVEGSGIYGEGWEEGMGGDREAQRRMRAKVGRQVMEVAREEGWKWAGGESMGEGEMKEDDWYRGMVDGGMEELERICVNADPNYGMMWFQNRISPGDTARTILGRAKKIMAREIRRSLHVYLTAIGRRQGVRFMVEREMRAKGMRKEEGGDDWVGVMDKRLREVEGLEKLEGSGKREGGGKEEGGVETGKDVKMIQWMLSNSVTAR